MVAPLQHHLARSAGRRLNAQRAAVPVRHVGVARIQNPASRQDLRPPMRHLIGRERGATVGHCTRRGDPDERRLVAGCSTGRGFRRLRPTPRRALLPHPSAWRSRRPRSPSSSARPTRRIRSGFHRERRTDCSRPRCRGARRPAVDLEPPHVEPRRPCRGERARRSCGRPATGPRPDRRPPRANRARRCCDRHACHGNRRDAGSAVPAAREYRGQRRGRWPRRAARVPAFDRETAGLPLPADRRCRGATRDSETSLERNPRFADVAQTLPRVAFEAAFEQRPDRSGRAAGQRRRGRSAGAAPPPACPTGVGLEQPPSGSIS